MGKCVRVMDIDSELLKKRKNKQEINIFVR